MLRRTYSSIYKFYRDFKTHTTFRYVTNTFMYIPIIIIVCFNATRKVINDKEDYVMELSYSDKSLIIVFSLYVFILPCLKTLN